MAKIPKIPGGLPEVTEWSPEPPPQPKLTPNQPEFHGNGRYGAPANPEPPTLRAPAVEPVPKGAGSGWMRRMAPTAEGAGRMVGNVARTAGTAARALGPAATGAEVVSHFNDYKINDPSVDSRAAGTFNALRQGDFSGAGRSLSKGALETLMDVGSAGANVADLFVPGKAPVSTKYNNMLRQQFGDQLVDGSGAAPSASAAATTAAPALAEPNIAGYSNEGRGKGPTGRPATAASLADPNGAIYRDGNSFSGKDVAFGAGVYNPDGSVRPSGGLIRNQDITNPDGSVTKSTLRGEGTVTSMDTREGHRQNLMELQRNAAERANAPPMGGATGIGTRGTSMMDDLVAKHNASKGPDVAGLSPFDRAQMQASLRQSQEGNANARTIAEMNNSTAQAGQASAQSIAAMHDATQRRSNDQNNATSLRGQDLSLAGHMAPLQYQQGRMALAGKYMQAAGGDPAKAQALAMADGAHDVAGNFSKNVEALQGQASSTQKIAKEQHEGARALFNGRGGSLIDPSLTGDAKASALKAAEDEAHNFAVQTVPGWNQLPIEQREKLMPKVLGLHELHQKTKNPDHAGNLAWARSLTSSQDNVEPSTGLREKGFYKGGQIGSRYGVIGGALTKDYEAGDVDFTPGGGKNSLRIAKPSAEALDALRKMTQGKDPLAD